MTKENKQKFFALNWWDKEIWIETCVKTQADAESFLARNNPQLILTEKEVKELFLELAKELLK